MECQYFQTFHYIVNERLVTTSSRSNQATGVRNGGTLSLNGLKREKSPNTCSILEPLLAGKDFSESTWNNK